MLSLQDNGDLLAKENISRSWISMREGDSKESSELRQGIEPWLTSLFQSEHLSLLVGSGLTMAVETMARGELTDCMRAPVLETDLVDEIASSAKISALNNNRGESNVEDFIRVIGDLLRGLEILRYDCSENKNEKDQYTQLKEDYEKIIREFADDVSSIEMGIATAKIEKRNEAFRYLVNFLMSFASRVGTRERLEIFTTNYDRLIEAGSELAGLRLLDRFVGCLTPIFRSSRLNIDMHYNPPGIRGEPRYLEGVARFTKLHGSIDWISAGAEIRKIGLPFGSKGISNFLDVPGLDSTDATRLMVYPNAAKDRETAEYPYVELIRDFAAAVCRPNNTLVTYGYGFGDDHINRIIKDMLTIPSTHLVIISYADTGGRIMGKYGEFGRPSQISLIIGKGVADLKVLVDYFLPKPSIDRATIRMDELLRRRYSDPKDQGNNIDKSGGELL